MPLPTIFHLYRGVEKTIDKSLKTLSDNVVSSTPRLSRIPTQNVSGDRH